jgi:hypothetical protein
VRPGQILAPALAGDAEFQRRFISESRAAAAIDDPHIVPVFAADGIGLPGHHGCGDERILDSATYLG